MRRKLTLLELPPVAMMIPFLALTVTVGAVMFTFPSVRSGCIGVFDPGRKRGL